MAHTYEKRISLKFQFRESEVTTTFDIDALRAVIAGTDLGSFARAAIQLGRSQSAISMQLKKLEQQTGSKLFARKGRGLVPTEAGEALVAYARRIVALHDEAALALGSAVSPAPVRLGLPQDFFDDVMPATLSAFSADHPAAHVDVRAGLNYVLSAEVAANRIDVALTFFPAGSSDGELLSTLPMRWLAKEPEPALPVETPLPLVLYPHPCLFRQAVLAALEQAKIRWQPAVTTPSLAGIWGALRAGLGLAVRIEHGLPGDLVCLDHRAGLPALPDIEVRLLRAPDAPPLALELAEILRREVLRLLPAG